MDYEVKSSFFKVYTGPGYPVDPKRQEQRDLDCMLHFSCVLVYPVPSISFSKDEIDHLFAGYDSAYWQPDKGLVEEMLAVVHGVQSELWKHRMRCAMMMADDFVGRLKKIELTVL